MDYEKKLIPEYIEFIRNRMKRKEGRVYGSFWNEDLLHKTIRFYEDGNESNYVDVRIVSYSVYPNFTVMLKNNDFLDFIPEAEKIEDALAVYIAIYGVSSANVISLEIEII